MRVGWVSSFLKIIMVFVLLPVGAHAGADIPGPTDPCAYVASCNDCEAGTPGCTNPCDVGCYGLPGGNCPSAATACRTDTTPSTCPAFFGSPTCCRDEYSLDATWWCTQDFTQPTIQFTPSCSGGLGRIVADPGSVTWTCGNDANGTHPAFIYVRLQGPTTLAGFNGRHCQWVGGVTNGLCGILGGLNGGRSVIFDNVPDGVYQVTHAEYLKYGMMDHTGMPGHSVLTSTFEQIAPAGVSPASGQITVSCGGGQRRIGGAVGGVAGRNWFSFTTQNLGTKCANQPQQFGCSAADPEKQCCNTGSACYGPGSIFTVGGVSWLCGR